MMQALDGYLSLIGQRSAELAHSAARAPSRIAIDEQLRQVAALGEPIGILPDNGHDIGGFALDWQPPRPHERRQPPVAVAVRRSVSLHLFLAHLSHHAARKHHLNEEIFVEDKMFPFRRTQSSKPVVRAACEIFPSTRQYDRLEIGNGLDLLWIAARTIEGRRAAPIMSDQGDILCEHQPIEPSVQIAHLIDEAIRFGRRFAGPTHPDEVGSETPSVRAEIGNNVTPLVRPRWISVQEYDRIAVPYVDVADFGIENLHAQARQLIKTLK